MSVATTTRDDHRSERHLALDTDIGTDVDDLLALTMLLGSQDAHVSAITTVYGDVDLRAKIVAKVYATAGVEPPHIAAGAAETLSGRPVWWPGHEGSTIRDLSAQRYSAPLDAVTTLAGFRDVVAIGPLTNIALALAAPNCVIERVVLMGGEFARGVVEHNSRCDSRAAAQVFASGAEVVAVGLDQTARLRLAKDEMARIEKSGALGKLVSAEMTRFWAFAGQDYNVPHDPIAVLAMIEPQLFTFTRGTVTVDTAGDLEGMTHFDPDPAGAHLVATDMNLEGVRREVMGRILRGASLTGDVVAP